MGVFVRYLTEEQQLRLWRTIGLQTGNPVARRDMAWLRLLSETGLRLGEFARVTVGDAMAALRSGYLFIPKEYRKGWNRRPSAAGTLRNPPEDLRVLMTETRRHWLRELLAARALLTGFESAEVGAPLVLGYAGRPMTARAFEKRCTHWGLLAGMPDGFSPHWLRHTYAKNVMRRSTAKDPRGVVKALLGHKSIATTGIYTEVDKEEVEAAIRETEQARGRVSLRRLRQDFDRRAG